MQNKLIELANNHQLTDIVEQIRTLDTKLNLKIGFLGEFSSGKSTLINALLQKKILPSMDKPTTKSVIELIAKDNLETLEFYQVKEKRKKKISAIQFSEIALKKSDSKAIVYVPSNDFFQDGYMMIDTPGISSLDESDTDITYGYLPFLDCAVICNHIQKGSLTQSIINFLLKDEIRPIINNILFVITNAHSKAPKSQEKIKEEIVNQLSGLNLKYELNLENIQSKVILISALEVMNEERGFSLDEIKKSFSEDFMNKKILLQEQRKAKEMNKIKNRLLELLLLKKESSYLNISELKEKEDYINQKVLILEQEKSKKIESLEGIDKKFQERIFNTLHKYLPQIVTLKNQESTTVLIHELEVNISKDISKIISSHFREFSTVYENHIEFRELEVMIQDLLKQVDMGKDIGMVILIELLTLGTAGLGGVLGFFLRSTSHMILEQKGESNLKETARYINKVNPLEMIGDMVGSKLIENKILPRLDGLSKEIARALKEELKTKIEDEVFASLEEIHSNNQQILNQLKREKSDVFSNSQGQLDDDILELKQLKMDLDN